MSQLLAIRQKLNLTQEELYERSGISVRTIQRIEAGTAPKGFTLKALAKGLGISEDDLIEREVAVVLPDTKWLKLINFSALPFIFFPPLNIAVPLIIMFLQKEFSLLTRKLVTLQIIWALLAGVLVLAGMMAHDWFGVTSKYMMMMPVIWVAVDIFIILLNAASIAKHQALRIDPKFSLF